MQLKRENCLHESLSATRSSVVAPFRLWSHWIGLIKKIFGSLVRYHFAIWKGTGHSNDSPVPSQDLHECRRAFSLSHHAFDSDHGNDLRIGVVMNERVGPHKVVSVLRDGWAMMCCFGDFTGGHLCLPGLKVKEVITGN